MSYLSTTIPSSTQVKINRLQDVVTISTAHTSIQFSRQSHIVEVGHHTDPLEGPETGDVRTSVRRSDAIFRLAGAQHDPLRRAFFADFRERMHSFPNPSILCRILSRKSGKNAATTDRTLSEQGP